MEQFMDDIVTNFKEKKDDVKETARLAWLFFQSREINERFAKTRNVTLEELEKKTKEAHDRLEVSIRQVLDILKGATGIHVEVTQLMVLEHADFLVSQADSILERAQEDIASIRLNPQQQQQHLLSLSSSSGSPMENSASAPPLAS